jgi:hypothetical protein
VDESGQDVLEDGPVGYPWVVATQRVGVHVLGQQGRELVPQGVDQA